MLEVIHRESRGTGYHHPILPQSINAPPMMKASPSAPALIGGGYHPSPPPLGVTSLVATTTTATPISAATHLIGRTPSAAAASGYGQHPHRLQQLVSTPAAVPLGGRSFCAKHVFEKSKYYTKSSSFSWRLFPIVSGSATTTNATSPKRRRGWWLNLLSSPASASSSHAAPSSLPASGLVEWCGLRRRRPQTPADADAYTDDALWRDSRGLGGGGADSQTEAVAVADTRVQTCAQSPISRFQPMNELLHRSDQSPMNKG